MTINNTTAFNEFQPFQGAPLTTAAIAIADLTVSASLAAIEAAKNGFQYIQESPLATAAIAIADRTGFSSLAVIASEVAKNGVRYTTLLALEGVDAIADLTGFSPQVALMIGGVTLYTTLYATDFAINRIVSTYMEHLHFC